MRNWALKVVPKHFLRTVLAFLLCFSTLFSFLNYIPKEVFAANTDELAALTDAVNTINANFANVSGSAKASKVNDLKTIAHTRRAKIKDLMVNKPEEVSKYLIDNPADFPQEVQVELEKKVDANGVLRAIHTDYKNKASIQTYYLFADGDMSKPPAFQLSADTVDVSPNRLGGQVTISGYSIDNQLWYQAASNAALALGGSTVTNQAATSGDRKVGFYYVTFADNRNKNYSDSDLDNFINNKFKNYISDSSSGRLNIIPTIHSANNDPVFNLPVNKTCELTGIYPQQDGRLVNAVYDAARSKGINPDDDVDRIIILDSTVSCGDLTGQSANGPGWAFSVGTGAIAHEFGHNIWLGHAGTWDCGPTVVQFDCISSTYDNFTDTMGNHGVLDDNDYGGYAKNYLGWLGGGEIIDLDANRNGGTFTLSQLERRGDGTPRVLRIKTFNGGPAYYIQYRKKGNNRSLDGPTVELASGSSGALKPTKLLDTTPDSAIGPADFNDSFIHDGQEFNDPFNGIVVKSVARDFATVTLQVSFYQGSASGGSINVDWNRPNGYLSVAGQKKDVSWHPITYTMSHRCVTGFGCDPTIWTDEPATTSHNGSFTVAKASLGYTYEYKVILLTKDDNDSNALNFYPWVDSTTISNECGGQDSCTQAVFWDVTNYRATLWDGNVPACTNRLLPEVSQCSDAIAIAAANSDGSLNTSLRFRGLPVGRNFNAKVHVNDKSGTLHLLENIGNVNQSDPYYFSCTGSNGCSVPILSFNGGEPILDSVKYNDQNGRPIIGPEVSLAKGDGSFGKDNWSWNYYLEVFPLNLNTCSDAGSLCQRYAVGPTQDSSFSRQFVGLSPGTDYKVRVCVVDCNNTGGYSVISDSTMTSSAVGPIFFPSDPFDSSTNNKFTGLYFDNTDFTNRKLVRSDPVIKFNWGTGSPDPGILPDKFSVRWDGTFDFNQVVYRFATTSDSSVKVYVDGVLLIDSASGLALADLAMNQGIHSLRVDYVHKTGQSNVYFRFAPAYSCADVDVNGVINSNDLMLVSSHFGVKGTTPWDLDGNKIVNSSDLFKVAQNFGKKCN